MFSCQDTFDLDQLKQEVESGKIGCQAKDLFEHLDKDGDTLVQPKELARHLKEWILEEFYVRE